MSAQSQVRRGSRLSRRVGQTLTRLARVTSELSSATTIDQVTAIVTEHMADAMGATIAALALREGDHLRLVGVRGLEAAEASAWQSIPLDTPTTVTDVVSSGERMVLVGDEQIAARYPQLTNARRGERSTVTVPLTVTGRTIGAIHLSIPGMATPHPAELEFLDVLADTCAQVLERIESSAVAAKQTARLAFLAEASIELASSLDLRVTTAKVARLAVPDFADWCVIHVVRGGVPVRIAMAHVDPEKVALVADLNERWPPDPASPYGPMEVVRTKQPFLLREITDEMIEASSRGAEHLAIVQDLHPRSMLAVPLLVRGEVSGVLTWVSTRSDRLYDEDDVRFAEHLARRSASALDNADLYGQTRAVAEQLQRAVLPENLAGTAEWEVHGHYQASGRTDVGGDFYDAFALEDGRYVVFVGDVMGRGVSAAAAMAQMRASIRAFASVDPSPEVVLGKLDRMAVQYGSDQFVTLAYALADAGAGVLHVANAGHLPPSVVHRCGVVEQLPIADGPPVGLAVRPRGHVTVPFAVGDTLVVVTDGLVERRGEDIDTGLARLGSALRSLNGAPLAVGLRGILDAVQDDGSDDDVAALLLRRAD